jgi:TolB-like protein/Tfp pilus assembly protein PilF/tRNA A-37 threonylcarbamoyl transferase component Bud32
LQPDALTGGTVGHHSVLEPLGEGGMGFVYKARDTRLRRLVALKVLRPERIGEETDRRRFLREAQAAAALNHPHIVTVHEVGVEAGLDYIVMEYIAGGTLADLMAAGRLPIERVLRLAAQVTEALTAAHEAGVVHRDLKPANIMLASPDHAKVVDFGLAKFSEAARPSEADTVSRTGVLMGTAAYMSPEQIAGRGADARSDVWAVGAVLYEMATGQRPFPEPNVMLLISDILNREPEAPGTLNPELPPGLEKVILKALEKDPASRYQSARELGDDLARLTAGEPPLARPRRRRMPALIAAGVVVASLAAATGGYLLWASRRDSTKGSATEMKPSTAAVTEPTSIAVLPFVNMSPDPEQEYFSDGLSEELLDALSRIPQLRVISRTSSFQFKGKSEDIRIIAKKLNVAHVLEGSVRKSGKRIRITAQLVKGADGSHLWSQSYDRSLDDIFALQEEIARSVAHASMVTLLERDRQPAMSRDDNVPAYNLYLQGKYFADRQSRENLEKAVSYYQQALTLDPDYARAWAGLARVYITQTDRGYDPLHKAFLEGRRAVERALELDPNLAEAHAVLGWIRTNYDWDWAGADATFKRALELEPRNGTVVRMACVLAATLGRFEEAIELGRRAAELDPLSAGCHVNLGGFAYYAGRWDEAEAAVRKGLELNPEYPNAHLQLGMVLLARSKPDAALVEMERENEPIWRRFGLALVYHALGRKEEADTALGELLKNHTEGGAYQIAEVYAFRGEIDKAFEWLERAYAQRDGGLAATKGDPLLRNLEGDPRYRAFLRKMRLPG